MSALLKTWDIYRNQRKTIKLDDDDRNAHCLILPLNSLKEDHVINTMRKQLNTKLPEKFLKITKLPDKND